MGLIKYCLLVRYRLAVVCAVPGKTWLGFADLGHCRRLFGRA